MEISPAEAAMGGASGGDVDFSEYETLFFFER